MNIKDFFPNVSDGEYLAIRALIENWKSDPCWDLENTETFEQYHDALLAYSQAYKAECEAKEVSRLSTKAAKYDCSVNTVLYIETLESRIRKLEHRIEQIERGM